MESLGTEVTRKRMKPAVCPCVNYPLPFQKLYEDLARKKKICLASDFSYSLDGRE
jgi:hypothetical protein